MSTPFFNRSEPLAFDANSMNRNNDRAR